MRIEEVFKNFKELKMIGNYELEVDGLNLCNRSSARSNVLSFAVNSNYYENVNKADWVKALIIREEDIGCYLDSISSRNGCLIISDEPEIIFYRIHEYLVQDTSFYEKYEFSSVFGNNCNIHKSAVIEDGVIIGSNVTIGAQSVIKSGTIIENDVTIGCCSVVGSEGFQLIKVPNNAPLHITHVGRCHICENVFIGDNTCIANSLFEGETRIGYGTKIDNLVHIAHNVCIGENVVVTAHVILCGSSILEDGVWIAPNSSVLNRVSIGQGAVVGLGSVVTRDVKPNTVVYGSPAKVHS